MEKEKGFWDDAEVISVYTRADAIADGVLVEVGEIAKEAGWKWPVVITNGVYALIKKVSDRKTNYCDYTGILWDVLNCAKYPYKTLPLAIGQVAYFKVKIGNKNYDLKVIVGPGDTPEPVLTILLIDED